MFSIQTEIEVILQTIADLGISLTSAQKKELIARYGKLLSFYKDPKRALEAILVEVEKITKRTIAIKEREKIYLRTQKYRLLEKKLKKSREKTAQITEKLSNEIDAALIIKAAQKKLNQNLNETQFKDAVKRFLQERKKIDNQKLNDKDSLVAKANAALTSVLNAAFGGLNITVLYNPGNLTGIVFYKPFKGLAPLDRTINESRKIVDFLAKNAISGKEISKLVSSNIETQEATKTAEVKPSLSPAFRR